MRRVPGYGNFLCVTDGRERIVRNYKENTMILFFPGRRVVAAFAVLALAAACGGSCETPARLESPRMDGARRIGSARAIVLIHGMYMTPACWDDWQKFLRERGFTVHAPAWPLHDRSPAEMRGAHPEAALAALTLDEVLDHYRRFIEGLDEKPILIGHSMGGLISQLLLAEDRAVAALAIDSAPPQGLISLKWSFLKSNWGHISPFADDDEPESLSREDFNYAFVNDWPTDLQRSAYETAVPESRRVGRGPGGDVARVDFDRARGPLLLIAGENDHIIPASLNRSNFEEYANSPSITDFRMFAGRTHAIILQEGWQEVADFAVEWIEANR
jgi:pimeloyl-ACP methyl ester carboxylesterase